MDFAHFMGELPFRDGIAILSPAEALACLGEGAVLVDLREPYETNFRVFDVAEVIYLPWTAFAAGHAALPRDRALILADACGIYGREAARILKAEGYANLANLAGGMIDWDGGGLPVRKDSSYELSGQCACKLKTRAGGNPLKRKGGSPPQGDSGETN
jgi:rhodanese-related sulfurtransferase